MPRERKPAACSSLELRVEHVGGGEVEAADRLDPDRLAFREDVAVQQLVCC